MSSSTRFSILIAAVAAMACSLGEADAAVTLSSQDKIQIRRCVGYMLFGPQTNGIEVKGQGFNCKPVTAKMNGSNLIVTGQLSHQLTWRPDDQVNYTFEFAADGALAKSDVKVEDGGVVKVVGFLFGPGTAQIVLKDLPEVLSLGDVVSLVSDHAASKVNNNWIGYAQLMLAGLQAEISYGLARNATAGVATYFKDYPYGDIRSVKLQDNSRHGGVRVRNEYPFSFPTACASICRSYATCKAWTYTRHDRRCYAKNSTHGMLSFNAEAVTGLR